MPLPPKLLYELYNDDCLKVLPTLREPVQLVLADPPYGTTQNKWDSVIDLDSLWPQLWGASVKSAAICLFGSQPFTAVLLVSQIRLFRHEWIWIKNRGSNFANTVREPFKEHEAILVFSRGGWTYNKQLQERTGGGVSRVLDPISNKTRSSNYGEFKDQTAVNRSELRVPSSWQKFNTQVGLHPTQKPVALMEYLIKTYSNEGDLVLDFAMGSGTTGVACGNLNRRFIGIDNDTEHGYFEIAERRIREAYKGRKYA